MGKRENCPLHLVCVQADKSEIMFCNVGDEFYTYINSRCINL